MCQPDVDNVSAGVSGHVDNGAKASDDGAVSALPTFPYQSVQFHPSLKPKSYHIKGTDPNSKILFRNVSIFDSTGRDPYMGDVLVEGKFSICILTSCQRNSLTNDHQATVSNTWAMSPISPPSWNQTTRQSRSSTVAEGR